MRILLATATYNESGNIQEFIDGVHRYAPGQDILVLDDNSPDGTGKILDTIQGKDPLLKIIHRPGKLGLGSAHIALMRFAIDHNYDALITMDADLSHNPADLPELIGLLAKHDFVQGSRFCQGGKNNLSFGRRFISRTANTLARLMVGLKLSETTNSLRGFRRELLMKLPIDKIKSNGYSFFVESSFYVSRQNISMIEHPIEFTVRNAGESKISKKEILKSMLMLISLFYRRVFDSR